MSKKLTPIVVLVDDETIARLAEVSACAEVAVSALSGTADMNGWTSEMIMGGVILAATLDPEA